MSSEGHDIPAGTSVPGPSALGSMFNRALDKVMNLLTGEQAAEASLQPANLSSVPNQAAAWLEPSSVEDDQHGRIMLSWPEAPRVPFGMIDHLAGVFFSQHLNSSVATFTGHAANDNTIWVGDEDFDGSGGFIGRDPTAAVLADGHTVVAWISEDNIVHAKVYPPEAAKLARDYHNDASSGLLTGSHLVLGEAAAGASRLNARLAVAPNDDNGFMAIWVTATGFTAALIAKASISSTTLGEASEDASPAPQWHTIELPPIPADTYQAANVTIVQADQGFQIAYETHSAEHAETESNTLSLDVHEQGPAQSAPSAQHVEVPHRNAGSHSVSSLHHGPHNAVPAAGQDIVSPAVLKVESTPAAVTDAAADTPSAPASDLAGEPAIEVAVVTQPGLIAPQQAIAPKAVVNHATGTSHVLSVDPGDGPGATIKITSFDSDGQPISDADGKPLTFVVTDNAIVSDSDAPALNLAPDIAVVSGSVAVVFVAHHPESNVNQLSLAIVDPAAAAPVVVTATVSACSNEQATISDLSLAATDGQGAAADLAVLWVGDADAQGYGSITAQFVDIVAAAPPVSDEGAPASEPTLNAVPAIVFLGRDGESDGNDDAFTLGKGRDPQAASVSGGALAVAWIAPPCGGDTESYIKGAVLSLDTGEALQDLDLTGIAPPGMDGAINVSVSADSAGDIVLSWLQAAIGGGFDALAALYERSSQSSWDEPSHAKFLKHFDDKPLEITFTIDDSNAVSITLAWTEHDGDRHESTIALDSDNLANLVTQSGDGTESNHLLAGLDSITSSGEGSGHDLKDVSQDHSGSGSGHSGSSDSHSDQDGSPAPVLGTVLDDVPAPSVSLSFTIFVDNSGAYDRQDSSGSGSADTSGKGDISSPCSQDAIAVSAISGPGLNGDHSRGSGSGTSGSGGGTDDHSGSGSSGSSCEIAALDPVSTNASAAAAITITVDFANDTIYMPAALLTDNPVAPTTSGSSPEDNSGHGSDNSGSGDALDTTASLSAADHGSDDHSGNGKGSSSGHSDDDEDKHSGKDDHDGHDFDTLVFNPGYGDDAPTPDLVLDASGHLKDDIFAPAFELEFGLPTAEDILVFDHSGSVTQHTSVTLADLAWI